MNRFLTCSLLLTTVVLGACDGSESAESTFRGAALAPSMVLDGGAAWTLADVAMDAAIIEALAEEGVALDALGALPASDGAAARLRFAGAAPLADLMRGGDIAIQIPNSAGPGEPGLAGVTIYLDTTYGRVDVDVDPATGILWTEVTLDPGFDSFFDIVYEIDLDTSSSGEQHLDYFTITLNNDFVCAADGGSMDSFSLTYQKIDAQTYDVDLAIPPECDEAIAAWAGATGSPAALTLELGEQGDAATKIPMHKISNVTLKRGLVSMQAQLGLADEG